MTPRSMDKTASRVSDERLAQLTGYFDNFPPSVQSILNIDTVHALTELQSLRSLSSDSVSDGSKGVRVKPPLGPWRRGYCDERVKIEQASFGGMYQVRVLDGVVNLDWPGQRCTQHASVEEAKSIAESDYEQCILSAPDSGTGGQQPVAWSSIEVAPKDGTVILGITMEAQSPAWRITWWDGEGWVRVWKPEKFVMPGPARWWPTHWVNLPPASPTDPKAGVVNNETRAFVDAVQLVEDAGWIILRPQRLRNDAGDQGPMSEEIGGFLYALLGSDTWLEAGAIWEQNPEQRKAAHAFFGAALNGGKP